MYSFTLSYIQTWHIKEPKFFTNSGVEDGSFVNYY